MPVERRNPAGSTSSVLMDSTGRATLPKRFDQTSDAEYFAYFMIGLLSIAIVILIGGGFAVHWGYID